MSLVDTWLAAYPSRAAAAEALSQALGRHYRPTRIGDYLRGDRPIPSPVRNAMLRDALPTALERAGTDPDALYDMLREPSTYRPQTASRSGQA